MPGIQSYALAPDQLNSTQLEPTQFDQKEVTLGCDGLIWDPDDLTVLSWRSCSFGQPDLPPRTSRL